jgi:tRNA(fMet)-specific endonuclease VapC
MIYLLDTNVCITYVNGKSSTLAQRLEAQNPSDLAVCSVVKFEFYHGALRSPNPKKAIEVREKFIAPFTSFPFDDAAATACGDLRFALEAKGNVIGPMDLQIAAIALTRNLILVTHNTSEFGRVGGLKIEDWQI